MTGGSSLQEKTEGALTVPTSNADLIRDYLDAVMRKDSVGGRTIL